ncbi:MAG: hypothetical protein AAF610_12755 [Pseudomonadota bacterium]
MFSTPFPMIMLAILVGGTVELTRMYYKNRRLEREKPQPDELTQRKLSQLEERVRVLEAIVTDGRHDLKREIDQL